MKYVLLCLLAAITLLACNLTAPAAAPAAAGATAPAAATGDPNLPTRPGPTPEALAGQELSLDQLMLNSASTWKSLFAEADVIDITASAASGSPRVEHVQVWIEQPARFRLIVRPGDGGPPLLTVSDGQTIRYPMGETSPVPPDLATPFAPPAGPSDTITPHPLGMALGLPQVGDLLFPAGLAQRSGTYQVTGTDTYAGRTAKVIEWSYVAGQVNDRLWVDQQTGVVLRQQNFGKQQSNLPQNEVQITHIEYDLAIPAETFDLHQPTPAQGQAPPSNSGNGPFITVIKNDNGYVNVRSGPGTSFPVLIQLSFGQTAPVVGKSTNGEWWQVTVNGTTGWIYTQVVELEGNPGAIPVVP